MKSLKTLIKLRKDEVDKRRKELADIEQRQQLLTQEHEKICRNIELETEAAQNFPEMAVTFAGFLKKALKRRDDLLRNIKQLQNIIDKKRDELQMAFSEQKKLEIVLDNKIAEAYRLELKKEQLKLDEIAAQNFRRSHS
jgi:flagellar export protein FliJ